MKRIFFVLFFLVMLACSSSTPLEPISTDADLIAAQNTTEMNLGRMLLQNELPEPDDPFIGGLGHECMPINGTCWICVIMKAGGRMPRDSSTTNNVTILTYWGFQEQVIDPGFPTFGGPPNGLWD